jgi:hypothetical protein
MEAAMDGNEAMARPFTDGEEPDFLEMAAKYRRERDEARAVRDYNAKTIEMVGQAGERAEMEVARLREALIPSGDTKAAYSGEFEYEVPSDYYEGTTITTTVPWTTIKEIMAAIRKRAEGKNDDRE